MLSNNFALFCCRGLEINASPGEDFDELELYEEKIKACRRRAEELKQFLRNTSAAPSIRDADLASVSSDDLVSGYIVGCTGEMMDECFEK